MFRLPRQTPTQRQQTPRSSVRLSQYYGAAVAAVFAMFALACAAPAAAQVPAADYETRAADPPPQAGDTATAERTGPVKTIAEKTLAEKTNTEKTSTEKTSTEKANTENAGAEKGSGAEASSNDSPGLLLPPRSAGGRGSADAASKASAAASRLPPLMTVVGSTCLVLSLFFVVAWLLKRGMPRSMLALPKDVVEVLGRSLLAKGQHLHLVRCGGKLLLISVSPAGAETLTEITDAVEVERLAGLCRDQKQAGGGKSFGQALAHFGRDREPAPAAFSPAGQPTARTTAVAGRSPRAITGEEHRA